MIYPRSISGDSTLSLPRDTPRRIDLGKSPQLTPRKSPRQHRSQFLVDSVVTACERILLQEGYDAATTNRIAGVAGISVGSFYQYFPGRESVLTLLLCRLREQLAEQLVARLVDVVDEDWPRVSAQIVGAFVQSHLRHRVLYALLLPRVTELNAARKLAPVRDRLVELVLTALTPHVNSNPNLSATDPRSVAELLVTVLLSSIERAIEHGSVRLDAPDFEAALTRMVSAALA